MNNKSPRLRRAINLNWRFRVARNSLIMSIVRSPGPNYAQRGHNN